MIYAFASHKNPPRVCFFVHEAKCGRGYASHRTPKLDSSLVLVYAPPPPPPIGGL